MAHQKFVGGNGHKMASELVWQNPDYFSWGFVRNPYDRLLSIYSAGLQHKIRWPRLNTLGSFEKYVLSLGGNEFYVRPHSFPMVSFLCCGSDFLLVDFVGRYERINEDWKIVCEKIGVPFRELPKRNVSQHQSWESSYTREMLDIVNQVYRRDFEVFNYEMV